MNVSFFLLFLVLLSLNGCVRLVFQIHHAGSLSQLMHGAVVNGISSAFLRLKKRSTHEKLQRHKRRKQTSNIKSSALQDSNSAIKILSIKLLRNFAYSIEPRKFPSDMSLIEPSLTGQGPSYICPPQPLRRPLVRPGVTAAGVGAPPQ